MEVLVNAAISADGKLSTRHREQVVLSGEADFARVDRLRADCDAVLVGIGTVLADDPRLTVGDRAARDRLEDGRTANPRRVVADSGARTPLDAAILDDAAETVVLASRRAPKDRLAELEAAGATVIVAGDERVDLPPALAALEELGVDRLLVEGGGELVFSLFADDLVDELTTYVAPRIIGGREAPTLADGEGFVDPDRFPELTLEGVERIDDGVLLRWSIGRS